MFPYNYVELDASDAPEEVYVAVFDYQSEEPGDLCFSAGEQVKVTKKESEWWTGRIGDRTGMFPYNYVELDASDAPEEVYVAVFDYQSEEPGDLCFSAGEQVK